jgi:type IV pilus biogenesis protein CpaD/CtpE
MMLCHMRARAGAPARALALAAALLALAACAPRTTHAASDAEEATVHTIFSTECNRYFDWCARAWADGAHACLRRAARARTERNSVALVVC